MLLFRYAIMPALCIIIQQVLLIMLMAYLTNFAAFYDYRCHFCQVNTFCGYLAYFVWAQSNKFDFAVQGSS